MARNRDWMYNHLEDGLVRWEFVERLKEFLEFAKNNCPTFQSEKRIRCPCDHRKCRNLAYHDLDTVEYHLCRWGFIPGYHCWSEHGETPNAHEHINGDDFMRDAVEEDAYEGEYSTYHKMVYDVAGPSFDWYSDDEPPNPLARQLYYMIQAANEKLWPGCETVTKLSAMAQLLSIKSHHHISEKAYDEILQVLKECLPAENTLLDSFYNTKRLMRGLGLPVKKIDCCSSHCMIYWGEDSELISCKFCRKSRYVTLQPHSANNKNLQPCMRMYYFPFAPRLQRLFASASTAKHMRWHAEHVARDGLMQHCSNSTAWKHFNEVNEEFSEEIRNVRLGLCTDGFHPFGQSGRQYSSWHVILTPYNLPPSMCLKKEFMFLTIIVPRSVNPKQQIDIFLQPLVRELQDLWHHMVLTYDISTRTNFQMRAALMWTISDFPTYNMLSGWSTHGPRACLHCIDDTNAFQLKHGGKTSWFDCHRRFLPKEDSMRNDKRGFRKGKMITKGPPVVKTGEEILEELEELGLKKVTEVGAATINGRISKTTGGVKEVYFGTCHIGRLI